MDSFSTSNFAFDFGIKPLFMVIGDVDFSNDFLKAKCVGVAYPFAKNPSNSEVIPLGLEFMFENKEFAIKTFGHFERWVEASDNDGEAVQIDFIEKKDGSYVVAISQEIERLIDRVIPKYLKDWVETSAVAFTQFKALDKKSKFYDMFKELSVSRKIRIGVNIAKDNQLLEQLDNHFFKKIFHFYKEDEIPEGSLAAVYSKIENDKDKKEYPQKKEKDSKEIIELRRLRNIKYFFPITFIKIKNHDWLGDNIKKLKGDFDLIQIFQAICNIILLYRLKKNNELEIISKSKGKYHIEVLRYLLDTIETFTSEYPPDELFTCDSIKAQLNKDNNEFLNYLKEA